MKTSCRETRRILPWVSSRGWLFLPTPPLLIALILTALMLGAGVCPSARAQSRMDPDKPYALIFGTVWGPDDRPVYGVRVRMRREDQKKAKWDLMSDHSGEFAQRVPAGKATYVLWVEAKDLKGLKSADGKQLEPGPEVTVQITADERQDIGLHLK